MSKLDLTSRQEEMQEIQFLIDNTASPAEHIVDRLERARRNFDLHEEIIFFAFRYALGRKSTAPSTVVLYLKNKWSYLSMHTQAQIKREIIEAIRIDRAGMQCDIETWKEILLLPSA